jgi:hypothetical protein
LPGEEVVVEDPEDEAEVVEEEGSGEEVEVPEVEDGKEGTGRV